MLILCSENLSFIYRIICMKRPGQKHQRQRQITNQLLLMEGITMLLLVGICFFGGVISGTNFEVAFCRGHSMEFDQIIQKARGISQWKMELGIYVMLIPMMFSLIFVALEMVRINQSTHCKNLQSMLGLVYFFITHTLLNTREIVLFFPM